MIAKVITLVTNKDGAGKSTLARNLADYWLNIGMKVMIIEPEDTISKVVEEKGRVIDLN